MQRFELEHLAASKLVAGREKDLVFLAELLRHRMVDHALVEQRVALLPLDEAARSMLRDRWCRVVARSHSLGG